MSYRTPYHSGYLYEYCKNCGWNSEGQKSRLEIEKCPVCGQTVDEDCILDFGEIRLERVSWGAKEKFALFAPLPLPQLRSASFDGDNEPEEERAPPKDLRDILADSVEDGQMVLVFIFAADVSEVVRYLCRRRFNQGLYFGGLYVEPAEAGLAFYQPKKASFRVTLPLSYVPDVVKFLFRHKRWDGWVDYLINRYLVFREDRRERVSL